MIPLNALPTQTFAVLGLGLSGRAAAEALVAAGKTVRAWDDNAQARAVAAGRGIPLADLAAEGLAGAEALLLSPGIPHTHPAPHPVAAMAKAAGVPIIGDVELLFRAQPDAVYIGITGTNGKSTTTALIGHILSHAGRPAAVGGNLGPPVLAFPPLGADGYYVLEMSSYQLELTPSQAFDVAVLLNITPDHLDRHCGFDGYMAAKRLIFDGAPAGAAAVIGADDDACEAIATDLRRLGRRVLAISGERVHPGGVYATGGWLIDATRGRPVAVLNLRDAAALPGAHNAQNAAAAYAAAISLGIAPETAAAAIATFPGLAHRQERIAVIDGVTFINDSKATNAEAAAKALGSYRAIYWIAGGRPKEGDLSALYPFLNRVRHAFLIGEAEARFAAELDGRVAVSRCGTLDRAVTEARDQALRDGATGATVLLSPACASFDQFANFEARGAAFRALVEAMQP
jgi:UDP-N-acetylmuramoylalanine--D-glutamate ligase